MMCLKSSKKYLKKKHCLFYLTPEKKSSLKQIYLTKSWEA